MLVAERGDSRLCIVFVLEGGRSRADAAALATLADALTQAGAEVHTLRHGLGRLSTLQVQRAVRQAKPHLLISTGVTSTRHLRRLAARLGCPLVCYFWPNATVLDPHRRPRKKPPASSTGNTAALGQAQAPVMQRAVVGSQQQRADLLAILGSDDAQPRLSATGIHVLPPLLDAAIFVPTSQPTPPPKPTAGQGEAPQSPPADVEQALRIGVYGAQPDALTALVPGLQVVSLDGASTGRSADADEARRLADCAGLVVVVHDSHDARDAARRICVALVLGKPVLIAGFGATGCEVPAELAALDLPPALLQSVTHSQLSQRLPSFCAALRHAAPNAQRSDDETHALHSLRSALHPTQVLADHVALLFEIAAFFTAPAPRPVEPSLSLHARALGMRFSRRPQRLILRYQAVVSELRGFDPDALITAKTLEQQLQTLLDAGYQAVPLSAFAAKGAALPKRCLALTFDGGHAGVAQWAAPLLQRLRLPFTVFVATDFLRDPPPWTWLDLLLRSLADPTARAACLPLLNADVDLASLLKNEGLRWPTQVRRLWQAVAAWPAPRRQALTTALHDRLRFHIGDGPLLRRSLSAASAAPHSAVPPSVDGAAPLLPSMIPTITQAGGELGSHGCSLSPLTTLDDEALAFELRESRRALIALVGRCDALAPPPIPMSMSMSMSIPMAKPAVADLDSRIVKAAATAGYQYAVSSQPRPIPGLPAALALGRSALCERSSMAPDGTFDAHRLWLSLLDSASPTLAT